MGDGSFATASAVSKLSHVRHAESGRKFRAISGSATNVIQSPKLESRIMRYELSDYEWTAIKPILPDQPRSVQNRPLQSGHLRYLVNEMANCKGRLLAALLWTYLLGSCTRPFHMPVSAAKLPASHEAIRNLVSRDDAEALNALADAAAVNDQFLRRIAIEVIGRHPRGRELSAIILGALGDSSGYVVRTACDVVALWKLSEAHDLVQPLLANVSAATRRSAIRALGTIWVVTDFSLIFHIYTNDSKIDVRREAASVLRLRVSSANWRTLFDAFYRDELARHRQWVCDLAETFSGTEILPLLLQLSFDLDGHVRKAASRAARTLSSRE